jgi:subtilisin family serine protease
MEDAVAALRQAGIVVVVSAGNYGPGCGSVQYPPAIYPQSFSVGNFDHRYDRIYSSSSRGPASYGGGTYLKPDLAAPGASINSSIRGGGYGTLTGTSMAAPHVTGAVALLLSTAPGYDGQVDALEHLLTRSAEPVTTTETCGGLSPTDVPNNTWGWGILDVLGAVWTATAGTIRGTVSDAESLAPIAGAQLQAQFVSGPLNLSVPTNPGGQYTLTLPAGTYDLIAQAEDHLSQTITHVVVISGANTLQDFALAPLQHFYLPLVVRGR